jgi:hypothetical protein
VSWNVSFHTVSPAKAPRVLQSDILSFTPRLPQNKTHDIGQFGMVFLNWIMLRFSAPSWLKNTYTFGFLPRISPRYLGPNNEE